MSEVIYTIKSRSLRALLRSGMTVAFALMRLRWWLTRPKTSGASAFCLTPEGQLVLIYSTYERGWNLPGGGIAVDETPEQAVLRELREELGLASFSNVIFAFEMIHWPNFKRDTECVFLLTDVQINGASNLEVERIGRFEPEALPAEISAELRQRLELLARYAVSHPHAVMRRLAARLPLNPAVDRDVARHVH